MSKPNLFDEALKAEGVSGKLADLARSIYTQESGGGTNTKTSNRGAMGGMQILPKTFGSVADAGWSIEDPLHNARAGIRYLKQMDQLSGGVPELTAAGYYGGPGGLAKAKQGVAVSDPVNPNAPNTLEYGRQVAARLGTPGSFGGGQLPPRATAAPSVASLPVQVPVGDSAPVAAPVVVQAPAPVDTSPIFQANAWQEFLRNLPQTKQPVQPEDLNFGVLAEAPVRQFQAPAMRNQVPNFQAFQAWRGRAA